MSFRQTISALSHSDRGFKVVVDEQNGKVLISFDAKKVSPKQSLWLKTVRARIGLGELDPQPYWGFGDILVDFDARTGHNHGTKFRFRNNKLFELYTNVREF